jgi:DNA transformation protein
MAVSQSYREFVLEQLGRVRPVTGKSMFGGVGIYSQGLFFALITEDRLYFKVNDATRPEFEKRGMEPFRPFGEDSAMGYYEVPANVVEDIIHLDTWMNKAIDVAAAAKSGKSNRPKRAAGQTRNRKVLGGGATKTKQQAGDGYGAKKDKL